MRLEGRRGERLGYCSSAPTCANTVAATTLISAPHGAALPLPPSNSPPTLAFSIGPCKWVSVSCWIPDSHSLWKKVRSMSLPHHLPSALPPHRQGK